MVGVDVVSRVDNKILLTTRQVADIMNVHESTIKRWCNEGVLAFETTQGGHRRLELNTILQYSRENDIDVFYNRFVPNEEKLYKIFLYIKSKKDFKPLIEYLIPLIQQSSFRSIHDVFVHLLRMEPTSMEFIFDRFFAPFLQRVGQMWAQGHISIADEHFISELLSESVDEYYFHLKDSPWFKEGRYRKKKKILVGCADGNYHSFGVRCARIVLEILGYDVYYTGIGMPYNDLVEFQRKIGADHIVISFNEPQTFGDVKRAVEVLGRYWSKENVFVLHIGGRVANHITHEDLIPTMELHFHNSLTDLHYHFSRLPVGEK